MKEFSLTLEELRAMAEQLDALDQAGTMLKAAGFAPTFFLAPGQTCIFLPPLAAFASHGETPADAPDPYQFAKLSQHYPPALNLDQIIGLPHKIVIPPECLEEGHDLEPQSPPALGSDGDAGGASEGVVFSPDLPDAPPAAPQEMEPPAPAAKDHAQKPKPWTAEEDEIAVELAAELTAKNAQKRTIVELVAKRLGRPLDGTYFRLRNRLKARIDARARELQGLARKARKEAVDASVAPLLLTPADIAPPAEEPGEEAQAVAGALAAHLAAVPRTGKWAGWTLQRDIEVLDFVFLGWTSNEITRELGVAPGLVADRFDVLTDKRRFRRDLVLSGLKQMAEKAA